jgi:hypothetical protein
VQGSDYPEFICGYTRLENSSRSSLLSELYEEISIRSVERLGEVADWLTYDIPREIVGQALGGKYRGQTQHSVRVTPIQV